ncbi:MAG TPA: urease accessory protein UreD [Geminicoccus sp.]|uniref:urease accessory protein UreD n=1 Tax=Geminicoccus sp. TaxID=2024832 RepID=UPI002E362294|nr:urease accessory protein UreD [Geminicoccus sp.]HEX2526497.1 urease accessory protein UreD [Geminicoccus sp.]
MNTSGGVVGGDRLEVQIGLDAGTHALVTTQAAEKLYRSAGATAQMATSLQAGERAVLAWLPQETILFDRCRVERTIRADLHPTSTLLAAEMLVFGRLARGERLRDAFLREAWEVRVGGRLRWAERFKLEPPNEPLLDGLAGCGGAKALATVVFAGPEAPAMLETARSTLRATPGVRAGVTAVNGLLVGRWLAADPAALRRSLAHTLAAWRGALLRQPARLPRLWAI